MNALRRTARRLLVAVGLTGLVVGAWCYLPPLLALLARLFAAFTSVLVI